MANGLSGGHSSSSDFRQIEAPKCAACNTANDTAYCVKCGGEVWCLVAPSYRCKRCGRPVEDDRNFCRECGGPKHLVTRIRAGAPSLDKWTLYGFYCKNCGREHESHYYIRKSPPNDHCGGCGARKWRIDIARYLQCEQCGHSVGIEKHWGHCGRCGARMLSRGPR